MRYFQPSMVNLGFFLFFTLFFASFASQFKWISLLVVAIFSAVFAYFYFKYYEDPKRQAENEEFFRHWRERLEARWASLPPMVRSLEHYLRATPEASMMGIAMIILVSLLLLTLVAYVS